MVQVKVYSTTNNIQSILISGHANSGKRDEIDMVCAQVSAIAVGALNAIEKMTQDSCLIKMESGLVRIDVKVNSEKLQTILNTLIVQLDTVAFVNSKYIQIKKAEV